MQNTPWTKELALPKSDHALAARLRVAPRPRPDLHALPDLMAMREFNKELKFMIFHPSAQDLSIIRALVDVAAGYAEDEYPSVEHFIENARGARKRVHAEPRFQFLTGPSGVGKSFVIKALNRLFTGAKKIIVAHGLPAFPLRPITTFPVSKIKADRLNAIAEAAGIEPTARRGDDADIKYLDLKLYQVGSCLLVPDEMQFHSMGNSNSQVTALLLGFGQLGRPTVFVANYDLGHKLLERPPQDTARLLSSPIVMLPDAYDDPAFLGYLEDIATVLTVVKIDFEEYAGEIHNMTFGLRRYVRRLFVIGYGIMRAERGGRSDGLALTIEHLRAAFVSIAFETDRKAVELSNADLLNIGKVDPRYRCPFTLPEVQAVQLKRQADKRRSDALTRAQDKDFQTREEREAQKREKPAPAAASKAIKPAKAAKPSTAAEWLIQIQSAKK